MGHRIPCEFWVIQYMPNFVRGEFVNFGVVIRALESQSGPAENGCRFAVGFTADWSRIKRLDPNADTEMLEALNREMTQLSSSSYAWLMSTISLWTETLSNTLQITEACGYLAEDLQSGLNDLMRCYVE